MPRLQQELHRTEKRPFHMKFQEHFRDYKYGNNKSKFSQHLSESRHSTGPKENIMDITHVTNKGKMLNTMGKIFKFIKKQKLINR